MPAPSETTVEQLTRQRSWLAEPWLWLLQSKVFTGRGVMERAPRALDVGCGPGLVMELFSPYLDVRGIDIDPQMVEASNARGQAASVADAEALPFDDGSFDIVYCSFLLLWTRDPRKVVQEMARVSREWVICLAEPDYGGRIGFPREVAALDALLVEAMRKEGADPEMGRKLQGLFSRCGLRPEVGVHPGMWSLERLRLEAEAEWRSLSESARPVTDDATLSRIRRAWSAALKEGSLVQYNPFFYALARKGGGP